MIGWLRRPRAADPGTIDLGSVRLPIEVRHLRRARRLTMRLAADGSAVRLSAPPWVPVHEARAFALARRDWLRAQLDRVALPAPPAPGGTIAYRGQMLTIDWAPAHPRRPRADASRIVLGGPQDQVPRRLGRWLEAEALRLMSEDLAFYCARAGLAPPRLALSRARRRWGSCAANGTIRINWRLIMAPDAVRRQVVAHEVAHLVHFDHSAAFHACLAELFEDDVRTADAWLKRHGRTLYQPFG